MADLNLDTPSFGIVDTIAAQSQQLVDSFLDNDGTVSTNPDDVKDINADDVADKAKAKPKAKAAAAVDNNDDDDDDDDNAGDNNTKKKVVPAAKALDLDDINDDDASDDDDDDDAAASAKAKGAGSKGAKPEGTDDNADNNDDFNPFSAFSKELYNLGAFVKEEGEDVEIPTTPEQFLETFNAQVGKRAEVAVNNFISTFGEDYQEAFDAIYVKGVPPKEYFSVYNKIQNFSELDLSSESNQEAVVRQTLRDLEYEDEDIETEVQRLKTYGDLEDVAKKHHKVLVKKEAQKLQELTQRQAQVRAQQEATKRQFASSVSQTLQEKIKTKDFDGIPLNPKLVSEVQDMLLTEKWKNSAGEPLTDFDVEILNLKRPENHAMKVKLALLLKILKNDPTLSTIKKSAITKQTNGLFNDVVRNVGKSGKSGNGGSSSNAGAFKDL